ncbi:MAG: hypothetical protein M0D55_06905 [Elusimicrobiota bacterium]|nr:MAG: hypothetical protein M0D55_06905 [Elusimicrobiota bacterium]
MNSQTQAARPRAPARNASGRLPDADAPEGGADERVRTITPSAKRWLPTAAAHRKYGRPPASTTKLSPKMKSRRLSWSAARATAARQPRGEGAAAATLV